MNGEHLGRLLRIELSDTWWTVIKENFFLQVSHPNPIFAQFSSMARERFKEILTDRVS